MSVTAVRQRRLSSLAEHWPITAVTLAYLGSILLMPRVNVPLGDDWFYAQTVEMLVHGHGFHILDATVVTLILPALWGALFTSIFGMSFVTLRWSTVSLVAIGGVAVYSLCRTLGASRRWSALAAAVVLFNPLGYVLSNSFMSDAPFAALMTVSALLYVKGLTGDAERRRMVIAGSVAAAGAFLIRQQGALIPLAVVAHLLLGRRVRVDRAGLGLMARVAGVPVTTGLVYVLWLRFVHGVPSSQRLFAEEAGFVLRPGMLALAVRLLVVCLVYAGLFILPVGAVAMLGAGRLVRSMHRRAWLRFAVPALVTVVGAQLFSSEDRLMPYVPQYLAEWGLGPADLIGGRPVVIGRHALIALTIACAASAVIGLLAFTNAVTPRPPRPPHPSEPSQLPQPSRFGASGARLLVAILVGQLVGIVPPSLHFQNPVPGAVLVFTLDRYLLPLSPLVVCITVWAVADLRLPSWPAWVLTAALAAAAIAGTHDFLVFQGAVWDSASQALRDGVAPDHLDGGAQWDAVRLYHDGVIKPESLPGRPWWVNQFAWSLDPQWIVSSTPSGGYVEVSTTPYGTWLRPHDKRIFLLRRADVTAPP